MYKSGCGCVVAVSAELITLMYDASTFTMSVCGATTWLTPITGHSTDCRQYAVISTTARYHTQSLHIIVSFQYAVNDQLVSDMI